jgi:hypothetical protein
MIFAYPVVSLQESNLAGYGKPFWGLFRRAGLCEMSHLVIALWTPSFAGVTSLDFAASLSTQSFPRKRESTSFRAGMRHSS